VPLPADPEKLAQVVTNLLQNAWQYTPPGETLRIFAGRTPEEVRFTFANPGSGLSPKDLPAQPEVQALARIRP
jgi:signal transduction histidine kinase